MGRNCAKRLGQKKLAKPKRKICKTRVWLVARATHKLDRMPTLSSPFKVPRRMRPTRTSPLEQVSPKFQRGGLMGNPDVGERGAAQSGAAGTKLLSVSLQCALQPQHIKTLVSDLYHFLRVEKVVRVAVPSKTAENGRFWHSSFSQRPAFRNHTTLKVQVSNF